MIPLDHAALAQVMAPVQHANGLPNGFYTDPEVFELERTEVFEKTWSCIGFAHDVPAPGDAIPIDFLGSPLVMLRDRQGEVRVFENVCRHRGMKLIDAPTRFKGVIRCPYHSWCYGLDGSLRATPHVGGVGQNTDPNVDRDLLGLYEVRSAVWMGIVFVNMSGDASEFRDHASTLTGRWRDFDGKPLFHGGPGSSVVLTVRTNWKLAVENYCESYHLPWVHPGLNSYSRLEDHYNIVEPGAFSGQGTRVYNPQPDPSGRRFPDFDGLSATWAMAAEYIALYPNVLLGVHRDHTFAIHLDPVGVDTTRERIELFYTGEEVAADDWAALRDKHTAGWREVFEEDIFVVEGMQQGRRAKRFDGGRFSPAMDEATHCFHRWIAGRFQEAR
ncbi:MAG: aromatic ring-hydroxylating oxygenase subunit alpha [Hyphomicrobiales bacterium]